jgi:ribosomal protein S18 acetylase RimI-like enzyme
MPVSPTGLRIRAFEATDQHAVRSLILQGFGEHFDQIDESRNPDIVDIAESFLTRGHVFVVAEIGVEIVGAGGLITETNVTGRMVRVSVARDYRRKGIGRALVNHLIAAAENRGLEKILVETNNDWFPAIRLYKSCGFEECSRDDVSVYSALELKRQ